MDADQTVTSSAKPTKIRSLGASITEPHVQSLRTSLRGLPRYSPGCLEGFTDTVRFSSRYLRSDADHVSKIGDKVRHQDTIEDLTGGLLDQLDRHVLLTRDGLHIQFVTPLK